MKKSKLIVPAALAVMLLSTAASVTGTVAWFTANRAVSIEATQFEVTSTDGSLDVALAGVANCAVDPSNAKKMVMTSGKKLTDASIDLGINNSAVVYTDEATDDGEQPEEFNSVASPYASGTTDVVLCVAWSMTFTYTFSGNTTPVNLFFDTHASSFTEVNEATLETGKGFRIGMSSTTEAIVWADEEVRVNCNYIYNNTAATPSAKNEMKDNNTAHQTQTYNETTGKVTANASYDAYTLATTSSRASAHVNLVDTTVDLGRVEDAATNQNQRGDYLGQFATPAANANSTSLTVYCYAWFEGTDPWVVNKSIMNTMSANMTFYTRRAA